MKEKDFIIRKIFLNFTVDKENVTDFRLNPPLDRFVKEDTFPLSRADNTDFELFLDFIKSQDKMHEMEQEIAKYALLMQNSHEGKMDFIV